ncbi:NAD(P)-binding protein [Dothidotthia symphoricarpi CBS 119687]|uniref:NAD(P)-binding protein n=1 Tax=Dothidotthia symphoricarpi CBS 119687 TaxID=1392245 RepID=A0A6A6A417_9PLEO|nr:NAD(P)-binding protein [Dothidotthia symphoricarpi CBS 119687]KAF2125657.1 NAD(P)-binding protein [Dothidotthia symphoricarpi CBS 119687]
MSTEEVDYDAITWPAQLTHGLHRSMYPLLEPSNPALATDKTVLITGVSGGIGRAIAKAWMIAGAKGIVISGRREDALKKVETELRELGKKTKIVVVPADVTNEESVENLWKLATEALGRIDVLINNAGSLVQAMIGEGQPSEWWQDFEVNIKGVYLNIHHFLAQAHGGPGTVITLSTSILGETFPKFASYIPSKLAQTKVMEFLNAEQPNIRTFSVFPGVVATDMPPKEYIDYALDDPMLTGGLSLFLCTDRAEWLRGSMVSVNWDLEEMEQHKEEILEKKLTKLAFTTAEFGKGGHKWAT